MNSKRDVHDDIPQSISVYSVPQIRDLPMITYVADNDLAHRRSTRKPIDAPRITWSDSIKPLALVGALSVMLGALCISTAQTSWWHELRVSEMHVYHRLGILTARIFVKDAFRGESRW